MMLYSTSWRIGLVVVPLLTLPSMRFRVIDQSQQLGGGIVFSIMAGTLKVCFLHNCKWNPSQMGRFILYQLISVFQAKVDSKWRFRWNLSIPPVPLGCLA